MEEDDTGCPMIRMSVSGRVFLLVPAYPGCPGPRAIKRLCVCVCVCEIDNEWWGAGVVICLERGAYGPADATVTHSLLLQ